MKCKHCGYETDSEKIFYLHERNCINVQKENGIIAKAPEAMEWNELKKYATGKGIDIKGKKKDDILAALKDLEAKSNGNNNTGEGEESPGNNNG